MIAPRPRCFRGAPPRGEFDGGGVGGTDPIDQTGASSWRSGGLVGAVGAVGAENAGGTGGGNTDTGGVNPGGVDGG